MNFIKNLCVRAFNAVANVFGKVFNTVTALVAPVTEEFNGRNVWRAVKGVALLVGFMFVVSVVSTLFTAGLTLLFGLLLPISLANLIAMVIDLVVFFMLIDASNGVKGTYFAVA